VPLPGEWRGVIDDSSHVLLLVAKVGVVGGPVAERRFVRHRAAQRWIERRMPGGFVWASPITCRARVSARRQGYGARMTESAPEGAPQKVEVEAEQAVINTAPDGGGVDNNAAGESGQDSAGGDSSE
jgi:hypothetical protein